MTLTLAGEADIADMHFDLDHPCRTDIGVVVERRAGRGGDRRATSADCMITVVSQSIATFFSRLGTVTRVRLGPDARGVRRAWAEFETAEQAAMALQYDSQVWEHCMSFRPQQAA